MRVISVCWDCSIGRSSANGSGVIRLSLRSSSCTGNSRVGNCVVMGGKCGVVSFANSQVTSKV